jgi:phosphocarrier protein FPr
MIGIVIVSHSAALAAGVLELANQMTGGSVPIATAGGMADPEGGIGTDPLRVLAAIEAVWSPDGVVVLMDLGSALLSAEMALEFLPPEQAARVYLTAAPLVEGTIAAAVQAMVGAPLETVIAEAQNALLAKQEQLGVADSAAPLAVPEAPPHTANGETHSQSVVVSNRMGLHARPAARIVALSNRFNARLTLFANGRHANARSLNQVALLAARQGDTVRVEAQGEEAAAALTAFLALAAEQFGDRDEPAPTTVVLPATAAAADLAESADLLHGTPAGPGIAIAPVVRYAPALPPLPTHLAADPAAEQAALAQAISRAEADVQTMVRQTTAQAGSADAAIFEAHLALLHDPDLCEAVAQAIAGDSLNAARAWERATEAMATAWEQSGDALLAARAVDVRDIGRTVLRHLLGVRPPDLDFATPVILVADDLAPSDTARLHPDRVAGLATRLGGATGHSAILARALGIPAIVGVGAALDGLQDGELVIVDGSRGTIRRNPDAAMRESAEIARTAWQQEQVAARQAGQLPAQMRDGRRIAVLANIGGPHDVATALAYGAEGVGLFRTEFLFMGRPEAPDEEEQFAAYREAAERVGDRPIIIRTIDVGGDKPLPYLPIGHEENPFLGWRAIRYCLEMPDFFRTQLRAICRATAFGRVKIMFPMIATVAELQQARALLAQAQAELVTAGHPFDPRMAVGMMIEVPSAVAIADQLAPLVDFFSIGTNDLTQYLMAADRGNARVRHLVDALHPAVLRAVAHTVRAGHAAGIEVGMCGELAGRPEAAALLAGLGLDELSMSAPAIPAVKGVIRGVTERESADVVRQMTGL